jgi:SAM-dependent methyltransferase
VPVVRRKSAGKRLLGLESEESQAENTLPTSLTPDGRHSMNQTPDYINFDRAAPHYEDTRYIPPFVLQRAAKLIVTDGGYAPGAPFLDAGTGIGRFARYLFAEGLQVTGVDISEEMLVRAQAGPAARFLVRADLRYLPFHDDAFEGALIVHILHLIRDWKQVVREIKRVIKCGCAVYVGGETGKRFASREIYFEVAAERGLSRSHIGAPNIEAILEYMAALGAEVNQVDGRELQWTGRTSIGGMLDTLRENPFSHLWHVTPEDYGELMAESERRTRAAYPDLNFVEEVAAGLSLWRVVWS